MSDRDILFRIGVDQHPETSRRLGDLADSVKRTMVSVESAIAGVGTRAADTARLVESSGAGISIGRSTGAAVADRGSGSLAESAGVAIGGDRLGGLREEMLRQAKDVGGEVAQTVRKSFSQQVGRLSGLSEQDMRMLLGTDDDDLELIADEHAEAYANRLRSGIQQQLSGGINTQELFSAQGGDGLKRQQQEFADESEKIRNTLQSQVDQLDNLDQAGERVGRSLSANLNQIGERGERLASGLAQAAQGLSFLFADSEDAQKLINTLLAVKGTTDLVLGGFKTLTGIGQFFSVFTDRSKLLEERQRIQTEQKRLAEAASANYVRSLEREGIELLDAVGGNQQHAAALRQAAAAANEAAAAEARLNAERARPEIRARETGSRLIQSGAGGATAAAAGRGGLLRQVGTGVAGSIGFAAISSATGSSDIGAIGSLGIESLLSRGLTPAATVASTPIAGAGAVSAAGSAGASGSLLSLAAPAAAAAAALASIALVGKQVQETFSGTATQAGSLSDTIGGFQASIGSAALSLAGADGIASIAGDLVGNLGVVSTTLGEFDVVGLSTIGAFGALAQSSKDLERAQKAATAATERSAQDKLTAELRGIDLASDREGRNFQRDSDSTVRGLAVEAGTLTQLAAATQATNEAAREMAAELKLAKEFSEGTLKSEDLRLDALRAANDSASRYVDAQKQQLSALREESELRQSISEQSIAAAERRIGLLDGESKKIQDLGRAAENSLLTSAERFARLSDAQQQAAIEAQRIAAQGGTLTDKQQDLLTSVGGTAGSDAVRRQNLAEARSKGFFETFGGSERQLASAAEESRLQSQQREVAAQQQRLQATIAKLQADGTVSLSDRRQIEAARQGLGELQERQAIENRERSSDRRRALGFGVEQNNQAVDRLAVNSQSQQRVALEITRQVEFQVILKNDLAVVDQRIQAAVARALRDSGVRNAEIRKAEAEQKKAASTARATELQRRKNATPS